MTNSRSFLNVCIAYTSREEMSHAVKEVAVLCENGTIDPANVTEKTIASHLYTKASPDPELLIRTSGEVRLSDFLLWQTSHSILSFINVLWPDFSIWNLLACMVYYQVQCRSIPHKKLVVM
ncbi:hypothetical protein RvY_09273-2 [Ramazzottius varieornatus]|uniref:Alkyl transferase n=1 Tax=Ramazzottius varieornatus TaxID=947166 RepID=A0A1D1VEA8_RAMVA|nr:hypothetical protein RvY_09273-2 [Ramazzottius varieornatus]